MNDAEYIPPKAYHDKEFLEDPEARPIRILSEYMEPKKRFDKLRIKDTILFFGSARIPSREDALEALDTARADGGDVAYAEGQVEMSRYYEDTR